MTQGFSNIVLVDFFVVEEDDIGSAAIYMGGVFFDLHVSAILHF